MPPELARTRLEAPESSVVWQDRATEVWCSTGAATRTDLDPNLALGQKRCRTWEGPSGTGNWGQSAFAWPTSLLDTRGWRSNVDFARLRRHRTFEARAGDRGQDGQGARRAIGRGQCRASRSWTLPEDSSDDADVHSRELLEARDLLRSEGLEAELFQPAGDPATMIEEIAESGAFGMVIVGTRGLGAFSAFFGDSVSEHVATHAYSTVHVAR